MREFFTEHVRGGAPLPTLVIGPHPYGLLPVMRRENGDMHAPDPLFALEGVLLELRERWRESLPGVQRLDPVEPKADTVAAEVLGLLPHPKRFVVRRLTYRWGLRTGLWDGLWLAIGLDPDLTRSPTASGWTCRAWSRFRSSSPGSTS